MSRNKFSKNHDKFLKSIERERYHVLTAQICILILGIIIWEVAAQLRWIDSFLTSHPSAIVKLFFQYLFHNQLLYHIWISVAETIVGFFAGTILGIIIAIALWWSDFWAKVFDPYLVVLNSLPKTALAPIIIIWVGAGYSGIIVTAISISIIVTVMNMFESFQSIDKGQIRLLDTFGASKFQILKTLILPGSVPDLINTLKISIGLSWVGVIVGEFLVSKAGIGYLIVYGSQVFKLDIVMMGVVVLALISALMYKVISIVENKFVKWKE